MKSKCFGCDYANNGGCSGQECAVDEQERIICAECGEPVYEALHYNYEGQKYCLDCGQELFWILFGVGA